MLPSLDAPDRRAHVADDSLYGAGSRRHQ
jgi:hypothetical protein